MKSHPFVPWVYWILRWSEPPPDVHGVIRQTLSVQIPVTYGCAICSWDRTHPLHFGLGA